VSINKLAKIFVHRSNFNVDASLSDMLDEELNSSLEGALLASLHLGLALRKVS
jgi:hypothetical protein